MTLLRDLSGAELAKALSRIDYRITRHTRSHLRMTLDIPPHHHITPAHDSLKVGTLSAILWDVVGNLKISREDLTRRLFG